MESKMIASLNLNTSIIQNQIKRLFEDASKSLIPIDSIQKHIFGNDGRLLFNVVICDNPATFNATSTNEVTVFLRLGDDFERFAVAVRTGKLDII
jgi:hypothetical protein